MPADEVTVFSRVATTTTAPIGTALGIVTEKVAVVALLMVPMSKTVAMASSVRPPPSIHLFLRLDLLHEGDAGMIGAGRADARHAASAEVFVLVFRRDKDDAVAMHASKGVGFLNDAAGIKTERVATVPLHYCSSK
jgi:hypothetical protein